MSNSYIVEPQETGSKKDDTLIIVVNDDGTIAVDQETLQNLIMNQSNANVSVVRVGQAEGDAANGDLTFTVDPPAFETAVINPTTTAPGPTDTGLVDPFMEMDPEQLEKLETALQSEQAKQILGENVAAMLDMLTVEEQQNSMKYAIELDHCYTSRTSPSDPEPADPLPVVNSPEENVDVTNSAAYQQVPTPTIEDTNVVSSPVKALIKARQTVGRPRKATVSSAQTLSSSPGATVSRSSSISQDSRKSISRPNEEEDKEDELSSSTESSDSETSDNDSDFGPRGPRRPGVRARGGRRGLTTRGGSMAATRRRASNKRVDNDQARRLDVEMAAAVDAMKGSEKTEKTDKLSPSQCKKQLKTIPSRKKDESLLVRTTISNESQPVIEKPLQTTNQVKANLINANMIKGEMILTKPGQGRNNQKVFFVQKKVIMKPNELTNLGIQKQNSLPMMKDLSKVVNQIQTKLGATPDGKLISLASKSTAQIPPQVIQQDSLVNPITPAQSPVQKQSPKVLPAISSIKGKLVVDGKKEKKKEGHDSLLKSEESLKPTPEVKTPEVKKIHKKEPKKSPGNLADSLGPALFSTPDIIRRVGSTGESKSFDSSTSSIALTSGDKNISNTLGISSDITSTNVPPKSEPLPFLDSEITPESSKLLTDSNASNDQLDQTSAILGADEQNLESKLSNSDDIQPPLDPASNTEASEEIARPPDDSVRNIISDQSGIEGEEHLLATLEMEASKHEEELLAEALLLQEQLDVDLTDPAVLDEPASVIPEPLLSTSSFETDILQNTSTSTELSSIKHMESLTLRSGSELSHQQLPDDGNKKDGKDVIQIVRGGRIITLPPIEAPATRSKRLQAKADVSPKVSDSSRKESKFGKQMDDMDSEDDEEENSDSEDDPNRLWCICKRPHNNRFMICCDVCEDWFHGKCVNVSKAMGKQMEEQGIEWVCPNCLKKKLPESSGSKVSKSPGVKSSKTAESPSSSQNINESSGSQSDKPVKLVTDIKHISVSNLAPTQCVVCKKEARSSSIYCSDACILMHAQETLTKDKPVNQPTQQKIVKPSVDTIKPNPDARVIVFERRTGKVLTGTEAPTTSNLKAWLKEHPTYEVVRPNNLNTLQIGGKTVTAIQTHGPGKISKIQQHSPVGQPKMVYAKVVGSKQTILTPSKKLTVISGLPNSNIITKSGQVKQIFVTSHKNPTILKQTTLKTIPQQPNKSSVQVKQVPEQKIKKLEPKPSTSLVKPQQKHTPAKKSEPEPIRLNVRKTLTELLTTRIKETEDLKLSDDEISDLALKIELELYKYFRDTGSKYKAKYRSLVFNIKDTKNLTLFRKIADRSLTPDAVVRLSPDEMASQELAEWREKETKHQLEMIKKNELDLMAQAKSIVVKTHKGEQIIENDGAIGAVDPKTPVQDIVTVLNNADNTSSDIIDEKEETSSSIEDAKRIKRDEKKEKDKDRKRDKDGHRSRNKERNKDSKQERSSSRRHRSRDRSRDRRKSKDGKRDKERDRDRDREKDKDRDKTKDKEKQKDRSRSSKNRSSTHSKNSSHKEYKDKEKKRSENEEETKKEGDKKKESSPVQADKPIEDRLWRHVEEETTTNTLDGNDSDVSDREPSSTVNIKTPDINEEPEKEKEDITEVDQATGNKECIKNTSQTVWRGFVNMVDVAKFFITAQEVSGNAKDLIEDLPDTVDVVGRISHETVWDYISKMKKTGSKEILVIRLTAANDEEKIPYITLYSYLNSRSRLGVVGSVSKNIKDFYIMPFSSQSQIPPVLMPLSGPGFEEERPHLLLGIIVRNKRKRLSHPPLMNPIPPKITKKDPDRSYTPPLAKEKLTTDKPTSRNLMDSATLSKIVPELSSKLDLTSSPEKTSPPEKDDDDEPYSPGELDEDTEEGSITTLNDTNNLLSTSKHSTELQRKMEELNRQIEEQKQQIQNISSSILSEPVPTLPGLGLDPPGIGTSDSNDAYSPTDVRSFTPPPQGISSKFTQPILDKVSDITIPPNLQEILANVKRQETSKIDPYLPIKPSASFLTSVNASSYQKSDKTYMPTTVVKESKSTLRSLSDLDLIKKAEEELAAVAAASMVSVPNPEISEPLPPTEEIENPTFVLSPAVVDSPEINYPKSFIDPMPSSRISDQPKPPGLEDEDFPTFPSTPPPFSTVSKSGVASNIKRKVEDDTNSMSPAKAPRTKSRWSQGTSD